MWIRKVAHQPTAVWWAAHQDALHLEIQEQIRYQLTSSQQDALRVVLQAWRYLFEAWQEKTGYSQEIFESGIPRREHDWYKLKRVIEKHGWDSAAVREYVAINRPYLTANPAWPKSFEHQENLQLRQLLRMEVEYPDLYEDAVIPHKWLKLAIQELRKNLEYAVQLETEVANQESDVYALRSISPISLTRPQTILAPGTRVVCRKA